MNISNVDAIINILNYFSTNFEQNKTICEHNTKMEITAENINKLINLTILIEGHLVLHLSHEIIFNNFLKASPLISVKFVTANMLFVTVTKNNYDPLKIENSLVTVSEKFSEFQNNKFEIILNFFENDLRYFQENVNIIVTQMNNKYNKGMIIKYQFTELFSDKNNEKNPEITVAEREKEINQNKSKDLLFMGFQKMLEHETNFQKTAFNILQTDNKFDALKSLKQILSNKK